MQKFISSFSVIFENAGRSQKIFDVTNYRNYHFPEILAIDLEKVNNRREETDRDVCSLRKGLQRDDRLHS